MSSKRAGIAVALIAIAFAVAIAVMGLIVYRYETTEHTAPYATAGWERHANAHTALTAALYWEAAVDEPIEGLWAIAWVIRNRAELVARRHNKQWKDVVRDVVVAGVKHSKHGGCQFSFVCNGAGELPSDFCRLIKKIGYDRSEAFCAERWKRYSHIAWLFLKDSGVDPTGGATHYFVGKRPYWYGDLDEATIRKIGSHTFGRTKSRRQK